MEGSLLEVIWTSEAEGRSIFAVFQDAGYSPNALSTLTPGTGADVLFVLPITPDERKMLQAALACGNCVVLLPGQDNDRFAWWRLDPATFLAIGYLPNGRGAVSLGFVLKRTRIVSELAGPGAVSAAFGIGMCVWQNREARLPLTQERGTTSGYLAVEGVVRLSRRQCSGVLQT